MDRETLLKSILNYIDTIRSGHAITYGDVDSSGRSPLIIKYFSPPWTEYSNKDWRYPLPISTYRQILPQIPSTYFIVAAWRFFLTLDKFVQCFRVVNLLGDQRIRIYLALAWNFWLYTDFNSVYLQNPKDQVIRVVELDKVNLPYYPSQPKVDKWSTCNFDTPNREPFFFCEELDRIILIQAMSRLIKSSDSDMVGSSW